MIHEFNSGHEINQNDFFPDFLAYIDTLSSEMILFSMVKGHVLESKIPVIGDNYFRS